MQKYRLAILVITALLLVALQTSSMAQDAARQFPETGHWVSGKFLQEYQANPRSAWVYGLPISRAFQIDSPGSSQEVWYQYFEKARFEYRPNNPEDLQLTISPLGAYLHDMAPAAEIIPTEIGLSSCQYFSQSGHQVCFAFLSFFQQQGGISQFGYPVSEVEIRDGRKVQYFQKARFEWHPENKHGERVQLTDIGAVYFRLKEDPKQALPPSGDNTIELTEALKVRGFVGKAVLGPGEDQVVYVAVQNQFSAPILNAEVSIYGPANNLIGKTLLTDKNGLSQLEFLAQGEPTETILLTVVIQYGGMETSTQVSYRVWW